MGKFERKTTKEKLSFPIKSLFKKHYRWTERGSGHLKLSTEAGSAIMYIVLEKSDRLQPVIFFGSRI